MISSELHNEDDLVRLIANGHEPAFRRLFDTYNKRLFAFAEGMLKSSADAEEVIQECFTNIWVKREELKDVDHPGQYLYRMVRNRCIDHLRKLARERKLTDQVWANIQIADHSLEDSLRGQEYEELIEKALSLLPEQKRTIYRLSRENEYTHEQIAAIVGLSRSRVNNILVETLKHIKTQLEKHSGDLSLLFWIAVWDKIFLK